MVTLWCWMLRSSEDIEALRELWEKSVDLYFARQQGRPPGEPPPLLLGCDIRVVACRNSSQVGVEGTVIADTACTLGILLQNGKVRVVAKKGTLFRSACGSHDFLIDGDLLQGRKATAVAQLQR